ncbi:hypothetical protein GCM10010172_25790 [Paractinoplanes ferrugineus]|uniref:Uncharacterized protein n=1 Tax=Paractinoplanes ferrugineus TaxID=113564 RepID=A0A919J0V6_9ACTN|nr:hypothetical protein [Actinoplanes ferrugineus]GIE08511.1 hypothetical protein Afe05nite_03510 [Actinoplanes ferrugineus]
MYRDRLRIGPGLVLGMALMIGGCGDPGDGEIVDSPGLTGGWSTAGCAVERTPEQVTMGGVTMPTTPAKLEAVMGRIEEAGRSRFADSYAGIEVDQERVRAVVYRVPSGAFDDVIRKVAEDTCVLVQDADHTATSLAVWHDRILADLPYWGHQNVSIVSLGARHDGSGVEIGTVDPLKARTALLARYGSRAPLVFVPADPVRPLPSPTSRIAPPPGS